MYVWIVGLLSGESPGPASSRRISPGPGPKIDEWVEYSWEVTPEVFRASAYTWYMADDEIQRQSSPNGSQHSLGVDTAAIEETSERATWGSHRGRTELYVKSDRVARVSAALLAVFVAVGTVWWALVAYGLFRPADLICADCAPSDLFRWTQLGLAVAGIPAALVATAYLTYFAATDRMWRHWRSVAVTFGILAGAWTLLVWIHRLF